METTDDRLAYYERMKENARQQNATHAFGFWCGAIATEKAAQHRVQRTALAVGIFSFLFGVIVEVLIVCAGGGCR